MYEHKFNNPEPTHNYSMLGPRSNSCPCYFSLDFIKDLEMTTILIILGWILCGLLSIYVDGLCDRIHCGTVNFDNQDFIIMIILGPIALFTLLFLLFIIVLIEYLPTREFFKYIHNLGSGRK